jgi:hypothetical protein
MIETAAIDLLAGRLKMSLRIEQHRPWLSRRPSASASGRSPPA